MGESAVTLEVRTIGAWHRTKDEWQLRPARTRTHCQWEPSARLHTGAAKLRYQPIVRFSQPRCVGNPLVYSCFRCGINQGSTSLDVCANQCNGQTHIFAEEFGSPCSECQPRLLGNKSSDSGVTELVGAHDVMREGLLGDVFERAPPPTRGCLSSINQSCTRRVVLSDWTE